MSSISMGRRRFLLGLLGGLGAGLTLFRGASKAGGAPRVLPEGFSLAAGKLPKIAPARFLSGVVASVEKGRMTLRVGSEIIPISLTSVTVWAAGAGAVLPDQIASRLKVGRHATIAGVTDENGDDLKVQQVWVGLKAPPGDSLGDVTG